ncbi:GAF domain-containing sensor histidine kinase [Paenibacillus sp. NPDC058071]|uniref:GAF domain-containing sensor histidine kinase n=1 Tax=Paenibacillus sp. NPDC058071 TaxID=3346326 RepID=UPI0036DF99ED
MSHNKWVGLLLINALLMAAVIVYFQSLGPFNFTFDAMYAMCLIAIGTFVYLNTTVVSSVKWFILMMYMVAWILVLLNGGDYLYYGIARILMSFAPNVLFMFYVHFTHIPKKRLYYKWNTLLLLSTALTAIALLSFVTVLSYVLFLHMLFAIVICFGLSVHYNARQREALGKDRKVLNISIAISLFPFIAAYTFLRNFVPGELKYYSIFTIIALPIVVAYLLIKRNGLQVSLNYRLIARLSGLGLGVMALFYSFCVYAMGLAASQTLLLTAVASTLIYGYMLLQGYLSARQLYSLNGTKERLEKERQELLRKMSYDDYLSTLSGLIRQFIDRTIPLDGSLVIWKENNRCYVLEQNGVFEQFSLKRFDLNELKDEMSTLTYLDSSYLCFPLTYKKAVNGWLVAGHKIDRGKFTDKELQTMSMVADTVSEILKTTEILHEHQQRFVALPSLSYEQYFNISLIHKTEEIRKSLSHYLHDEVLQVILAARNMTESLSTQDKEIQTLILDTLNELNASIRERLFDIYPTTLADLGLYQSLSALCGKLKAGAVQQPQLKIRLESDPNLEIDGELQYLVFRTAKELLQNAVKHAQASEIVVSLHVTSDGLLLLDVLDDGVGFDFGDAVEEDAAASSIGLLSIKQEMKLVRGDFSIRRNDGPGMHIHIKIPMKGGTEDGHAHYAV